MSVSQSARTRAGSLAQIAVTTRGDVSKAMVGYAREKVVKVYHYTPDPIRTAHVVLTQSADPGRPRPAMAEVGLEFDGTHVRAHAAAPEMDAAIDLVVDRLQNSLVQHRDRVQTRHRWLKRQTGHGWRHGTPPAETAPHFPRPAEEREVVRRKSLAMSPTSVGEAAFDMDLLGHDFYLFVDRQSGHDAVIRRTPDGYAVRGDVAWPTGSRVPVAYDGSAPTLTDVEARARLDLSGEPFVFYLEAESGRGRVLYLRYDGHYGLIEAAAA